MKKLGILLIALVLLAFVGCQPASPAVAVPAATEVATEGTQTTYPLVFKDEAGKEVTLDSEPNRVISLAPSITETIFSLGAESKLIGRTDWCVYPEAASAIESIGSLQEPNIEAIVALNPDLIIVSSLSNEDTLKKFEELNLKVVVITAQESFEGLYTVIGNVGQVLNVPVAAMVKIEALKARVAVALEKVKNVSKPTVYYAVAFGESGEYTGGGDTFIHQMVEMAGGDNIAKDVKGWSYSLEQLVEKDPEYVIVSNKYDSKNLFTIGENYKNLSAVKKGHVVEVNEDLVQIQGPRLVDGLEALIEAIHPEIQ